MSFRKILAIKLRALGDTVLMTAPVNELRRAYPEAEIHVAVLAAWSQVFEAHPGVAKVWTYERHREPTSRAKALARLAIRLRKEKYDCVVNFHASPSSAVLAYATGAQTRSIHFHGHRDKNRYSTVVIPGKGTLKPVIERDMDTVRALGTHAPAGRMPQFFLQAAEVEQARARIESLGAQGPLLGIGLGASRPSKSWPIDRFAGLAVCWRQKTRGGVLGFLSMDEEELAHEFMKAVDDFLMATVPDQTERAFIRSGISCQRGMPIRQLAGLISHCSAFAGNDSGPRHIAVAVQTPTVTLFGPEHPYEWHPYPTDLHPYLFVEGLPCRKDAMPGMPAWCGIHACVEEQHRCLRQIGIEEVMQACERVSRK